MTSEIRSPITDAAARDAAAARPSFRESAAEALRYWEPRRSLYNLVLAAVVVTHYVAAWPDSKRLITRDVLFVFFGLAVLANVCYCAAYGVDLFVQFSGLRSEWSRRRWVVLATGIAFAAVIAHFVTMGVLSGGGVG